MKNIVRTCKHSSLDFIQSFSPLIKYTQSPAPGNFQKVPRPGPGIFDVPGRGPADPKRAAAGIDRLPPHLRPLAEEALAIYATLAARRLVL